MYKWFADDTTFKKEKEGEKANIHLYGGILISRADEILLIEKIKKIKQDYTYPDMPVKWNMKDTTITEIYDRFGRLEEYEKLKRDSYSWRKRIFQESLDLNYKIFISCIENYLTEKKEQKQIRENLSSMLFSNALMRLGMYAKYNPISHVQVVLDWPTDNNPKPFNDEYYYAYNRGKTSYGIPFHSGPLFNMGFEEAICFTKCTHSNMLQFADMVIGATRDFFETHMQGRSQSIGKELTELILPKFYGYPQKKIIGRGINISSQNEDFKNKVQQIIASYSS